MDAKTIAFGVGATLMVGAAAIAGGIAVSRRGDELQAPSEDYDHSTLAGSYVRSFDLNGDKQVSYDEEALRFGDGGAKLGDTYSSLRPLVLAADMALGNRDGGASQAEIAAVIRSYDATPASPMSKRELTVFQDEFGASWGFGSSRDDMTPAV